MTLLFLFRAGYVLTLPVLSVLTLPVLPVLTLPV